ncbi:hypothetical protein FRZ67_15470 [Panacibacter ginsenosidivorans]|uniref:Uncharacterized protein n=1 Tax=Panacibacter ginsenosidivorans TaxID=1813871 RepID=A0A5B8VED5_9BACT|nr:hypothetical protein [Panacibacter ginsenosidivorans]QEC68638.1 hypothetical protein FRZ67_15470 [Panacibacter ginsenosidivorans]
MNWSYVFWYCFEEAANLIGLVVCYFIPRFLISYYNKTFLKPISLINKIITIACSFAVLALICYHFFGFKYNMERHEITTPEHALAVFIVSGIALGIGFNSAIKRDTKLTPQERWQDQNPQSSSEKFGDS